MSKDEVAGTIEVRSVISLWTWGEDVSIRIAEEEGGNTVSVASGVSPQLFDWGKSKENEKFFHKQLKHYLRSEISR